MPWPGAVYDAAALIESDVVGENAGHLDRQERMLKFHAVKVAAFVPAEFNGLLEVAIGLQRWDAVCHPDGRADLHLAEERALVPGDAATLIPPQDVHNHGHVAGTGASPYSLILLGDDMLLFDRQEYDADKGTWRALAAGDPGRANR